MKKDDIIKKIINQANSLNKKVTKFKTEGIDDHYDFITSMFNDEQMIYTDSGLLSKSKKFYGNQNELQLKRTLSILKQMNNHEIFGTVRKYKKFATESWITLQDTVKDILLKKGYSEQDVNMIINTKSFYNSLLIAFKELKKGYGSDQVVERVFLEYLDKQNGISEDDLNQAVSDIEYNVSKQRELDEELREYMQYKEMKRGKR